MGATMTMASGHAVISSPASMCERPCTSSSKKGSDKKASIWAQNALTDEPIDRANTGLRSRSTGNSGAAKCHWRRT
ncbi:hypothetical protein D3C71_1886180 [compost metagenome]